MNRQEGLDAQNRMAYAMFYNKPLVKPGGTVIIMNPVDEVFHPEYHVAYRLFYDEVLPATTDPFVICAPPEPVAPRSLTWICRVSMPTKLLFAV